MPPFVLALSDPDATLEAVGGNGIAMAILGRAGLPVPDNLHISSTAYREFAANELQPNVLRILETVDAAILATLEAASQATGRPFAGPSVPGEIGCAISGAYANLRPQTIDHRQSSNVGRPSPTVPVAVCSSVTVEDLPFASFAGQQSTYLNIRKVTFLGLASRPVKPPRICTPASARPSAAKQDRSPVCTELPGRSPCPSLRTIS